MAATAYVGIGSNLGDRAANLRLAVAILKKQKGVRLTGLSRIYETAPQLHRDQPWFLNAAVRITTTLPPEELLRRLRDIEKALKRKKAARYGPRTLDLDLLQYGRVRRRTRRLTLPHPRMLERAFVLRPLLDLTRWVLRGGRRTAVGPLLLRPALRNQRVFFFPGGTRARSSRR